MDEFAERNELTLDERRQTVQVFIQNFNVKGRIFNTLGDEITPRSQVQGGTKSKGDISLLSSLAVIP